MTREEALQILDTIPTIGEQVDALELAIEALSVTCSEKPNNCEDAISREAAQDYIAKYLSQYLYDDVREAVEVIDEYIGELPSVTPKQKMGHWVEKGYNFERCSAECSVCGKRANRAAKDTGWGFEYSFTKYCPNCGAKMSENPTGSNCSEKPNNCESEGKE